MPDAELARRTPLAPVAERAKAGRAVRARVPRSSLGGWTPPADRRAPADLLADQEVARVPELVAVRHQRMAESQFAFYRGAAAVLATDLASRDTTGLEVQLCGDAHLVNFGTFASPERTLVFDLNDFDETLPGPFEWDLMRLVASFEVAARTNGFDEHQRRAVQQRVTGSYCAAMREFATHGYLRVWHARLSVDDIEGLCAEQGVREAARRVEHMARKARTKDNLKAFDRLITVTDGEPRFVSDPPLLERAEELFSGVEHDKLRTMLQGSLAAYRQSLQPDRAVLLDRYRLVDLARKVVGVGSVGTRCWVALFVGLDDSDPLFLQIKEAEASVLEPHLGASDWPTHGQRVVEGQRLMQSASDIFLGWERQVGVDGLDHDYYFRQLWDWKGSADVDDMDPASMDFYGFLCGRTLARAHARTGDPVAISGYVGSGKSMAAAMCRFASDYADQNERDHAGFVAHLATSAEGGGAATAPVP